MTYQCHDRRGPPIGRPALAAGSALAAGLVIAAHGKGSVRVRVRLRPLDPGRHRFMDEYPEDTIQGVVISE
ncbi:MAG TPA: hypothetical protein VN980_01410 [Alphaproteobacteria bacterium]|nr:hypothetical protein [Alphaproteobacteria bacterium]